MVILDGRKATWKQIHSTVDQVQASLGPLIHTLVAIRPESAWDSQNVDCMKGKRDLKVTYSTVGKLSRIIDQDQLVVELGGNMIYKHDQWVRNQLEFEALFREGEESLADMDKLRVHLDNAITGLSTLEGMRKSDENIDATIDFYRKSIDVPKTILKRGRELIARLETDDESGFKMGIQTDYVIQSQKKIRELLDLIHTKLVTLEQSYAELIYLTDHVRELKFLENGIDVVVNWVLGHGADLYRQLAARGVGLDETETEELQRQLEALELRCREYYGRYAEVRHRLSIILRSNALLPPDLKSKRDLMDSVCRTFAGLLERRRRALFVAFRFHQLRQECLGKAEEVIEGVGSSAAEEDLSKAESALQDLDDRQSLIDPLFIEVEIECKRLIELLSPIQMDQVGRQLNDSSSARESQFALQLLENCKSSHQAALQAISLERLRLQRIVQIFSCEKDANQALDWLKELETVLRTSNCKVGSSLIEVQNLKDQQQKLHDTAKSTYEYGAGLLAAALFLRRSARLPTESNRQMAAQMGRIWTHLLAASREQLTRLRVAGIFHRDMSQHERTLKELLETVRRSVMRLCSHSVVEKVLERADRRKSNAEIFERRVTFAESVDVHDSKAKNEENKLTNFRDSPDSQVPKDAVEQSWGYTKPAIGKLRRENTVDVIERRPNTQNCFSRRSDNDDIFERRREIFEKRRSNVERRLGNAAKRESAQDQKGYDVLCYEKKLHPILRRHNSYDLLDNEIMNLDRPSNIDNEQFKKEMEERMNRCVEMREALLKSLGRTIRLGKLLRMRILESLLTGDGENPYPENRPAAEAITFRIQLLSDQAQELDAAILQFLENSRGTDKFKKSIEALRGPKNSAVGFLNDQSGSRENLEDYLEDSNSSEPAIVTSSDESSSTKNETTELFLPPPPPELYDSDSLPQETEISIAPSRISTEDSGIIPDFEYQSDSVNQPKFDVEQVDEESESSHRSQLSFHAESPDSYIVPDIRQALRLNLSGIEKQQLTSPDSSNERDSIDGLQLDESSIDSGNILDDSRPMSNSPLNSEDSGCITSFAKGKLELSWKTLSTADFTKVGNNFKLYGLPVHVGTEFVGDLV
ncbi:SEC14 domain and spectrin repeat-containing protein 1-B-like isoform X2 [Artemia franciscana]